MGNELNFWVVGGDLRQAKLAELLAADGHTVHTWALERMGALPGVRAAETLAEAERADCVVLPLPAAGEGGGLNAPLSEGEHPMAEVLDALRPGQVLCAGRVDPATAALAAARGLTLHDYFAREELAVANAVPTALAKGHRGFPASNRPESPSVSCSPSAPMSGSRYPGVGSSPSSAGGAAGVCPAPRASSFTRSAPLGMSRAASSRAPSAVHSAATSRQASSLSPA